MTRPQDPVSFDLGIISFAIVGITDVIILCSLRTKSSSRLATEIETENLVLKSNHCPHRWFPNIILVSHMFVSANYLLGTVLVTIGTGKVSGFVLYCSIFTFLWAILACMGKRACIEVLKSKEYDRVVS